MVTELVMSFSWQRTCLICMSPGFHPQNCTPQACQHMPVIPECEAEYSEL